MTSKIHIKTGAVELDFEGESEFLKSDILPILNQLLSKPENHNEPDKSDEDGRLDGSTPPTNKGKQEHLDTPIEEMGMNTMAVKLGVKTGADLIIASCAYLKFIKNKNEFPRIEILETQKEATHYYTVNHSRNLSHTLERLVKSGKINERKPGVYTLPQNIIDELRPKLVR